MNIQNFNKKLLETTIISSGRYYRGKNYLTIFNSKYTIDSNGCFNWIGADNHKGYGIFYFKNKPYLSHRLSYILEYGSFNNTLYVCHKCDNTKCINPKHLFLGTQLDNIKDMYNKKRNYVFAGEKGSKAKLTNEQVLEIRERYISDKITTKKLAELYNISESNCAKIISRETWKNI